MTTSIEQQIESNRLVRFLSRSKVAILAGLVIIVVGGSVALFTPVIPNLTAAFGGHSTSTALNDTVMFGFDARHTHVNACEHMLTYSTVSQLVLYWSSPPTGGSIFSSPVVANGVVYVGSFDGILYAFDTAGCGSPPCAPLWTSPTTGDALYSSPAVAGGVVYIGSLGHKLYAFHLRGKTN